MQAFWICLARGIVHFTTLMQPHRPSLSCKTFLLLCTCAATLCAFGKLAAQDVTVVAPALFDTPDAAGMADTPPTMRKKWKPDFPEEMRKAADPGYVMIIQNIDAKGRRRHYTAGASAAYYQNSVNDAYYELQNTAAQKDGKPVAAYSWMAVVFNPASAHAKNGSTTPRLVKPAPILVSQKQYAAFPKGSRVLDGTIDIDISGKAKNLKLASNAAYAQAVRPAIEHSLSQWQFASAQSNGQPVEATVNIGFVVQVAPNFKAKVQNNSKQPEAVSRKEPIYPAAMRNSGLVGEVTLQFIVNTDGKVIEPTVLRSNNPGFEQAAIEAILKWKFKPGTVDGMPVKTRMQLPISFNLDGLERGTGYTSTNDTPSKKQIAKMPEGLRYDVAPKAKGVIYPVYPYAQLREKKTGKATVVVLVNQRGLVVQMAIVEESAPEFGLAAMAACEYFEFDPGMLEGRPTTAAVKITLEFNRSSIFVSDEDTGMLSLEKKSPNKILGANKLDAMPKPISMRKAPFPLAARLANLSAGEATVEFLIDTDGKVRLPRILSSTHPSFGYIAVQTVANWLFEPPKAGGKAVVTRAKIPMHFKLKN